MRWVVETTNNKYYTICIYASVVKDTAEECTVEHLVSSDPPEDSEVKKDEEVDVTPLVLAPIPVSSSSASSRCPHCQLHIWFRAHACQRLMLYDNYRYMDRLS